MVPVAIVAAWLDKVYINIYVCSLNCQLINCVRKVTPMRVSVSYGADACVSRTMRES